MITFYNATKGGVDSADQLCGEYNCARNTRRWPMVIFYGVLNVAGINASVIYNSRQAKSLPRRQFIKELSKELMRDQLIERAENMHLPRETRSNARKFAGMEPVEENAADASTSKRKHCKFCKNRKSRYYCKKCNTCICLQHASYICSTCMENF